MDAISSASSVIAVIQLTGSIAKFCGGYIQEVKDARNEIFALQQAITGLEGTLQDLQKLLQSNNGTVLSTSSQVVSNMTECQADLRALEVKLDPGKGKKLMRKVGLRALKWPLKRAEVEGIVQKLERYKSSFLLSLQVDQTSLMVDKFQDLDIGKIEYVMEAGFESYSDRDEFQCLQGTRTVLLQQIMDWAISPTEKSIFWLRGMAGTGKSTISRTVASSLKDKNCLGASFFFKRGGGDRGNAKKFFPTLARQLMLIIPSLRSAVHNELKDDPDIASKSLREQFEKLLLWPLLNIDQVGQQPVRTVVMVVDALDECDHYQDVRNIIQFLPRLQKVDSIRLRVFLTSRPELPISLGFSEITEDKYRDLALHEIPEEVTEHDIHLFLQDRFAKIRQDRDIFQGWPGDEAIQQLVTMSVPLFISAATVCRYIENSKWEPKFRLTELLNDQAKYVSRMEKTYMPIMTRLLDDQESDESEQQQILHEFHEIIGTIILLATPFSVNTLSEFLGIKRDLISNRLNSFQSVLIMERHLQKDICRLERPSILRENIDYQLLEQYLPPELQYSCRYWIYHLDQSQAVSSKTEDVLSFLKGYFLYWVEVMSLLDLLSEVVGMLNLLQSLIPHDDKSGISEFLYDGKRFVLKNRQIAEEAPLQLYCAGLIFAPETSIIRREFKSDFPTWICQFPEVDEGWSAEIQTLEGHSNRVNSVAFSPDGQLLASGSHDSTVKLWDTATGGLQQTLNGSSRVNSVAFSPNGKILASGYSHRDIRLWSMPTGDLQQSFRGSSDVTSVAFFPNNQILATGSFDKIVRLWDIATGSIQQTYNGHSGIVSSVAISPDGRLLASGSEDAEVRLWDIATGHLEHVLESYSAVFSVAFSPDSRLLASGTDGQIILLWDIATGSLQQTFEEHTDRVTSVAFSPDGQLLASSSGDGTINIWNMATSKLEQAFGGHHGLTDSVIFSPDSKLVAFCSADQTVRLWDIAVGKIVQQFDKDWSTFASSIAFSPTGQLLALGSGDSTIQLWDTATGGLQQILKGHSSPAWSVVFSPNGQLLASSSQDDTIQLWNIATGNIHHILEGHLGTVWSMAFTPDSLLLASGSGDSTVRLWDTTTGSLQQTMKGHSDVVRVVGFSPDGRLLASGSDDSTVRLWNTVTGSLQQTMKGHSGIVRIMDISPNGRLLASGCDGLSVRLWDTATGDLQDTLCTESFVNRLKFSRAGSSLIVNGETFEIPSRFHGHQEIECYGFLLIVDLDLLQFMGTWLL
ncbi:WD40-repeat-containing domain protein [Penicillium verhagenii]|uniref:WD40-repeat-containing domain protein n=1 Tax=Penicillium verhagenii TaxID=1562060 RepID=UPI00254526C2|nr:WD40-repeat-containing domain protein [Penicillium verhagenii]KAJ5936835.1 WD40-repeat-containing domain protein [Penicillium verhagenii]